MKSNFPTYNQSFETGEKGVTIFKGIVENDLGWIFRRNHQENDFGIDGFIDIISEKREVTGKSLAVQIKCGLSFFNEKNDIGWLFRGEDKHLNYFLNFQIPVLVVLINPNDKTAYWEKVTIENTSKKVNSWTITVPQNQLIEYSSKEKLKGIVGPTTDYVSQFDNYWELNKRMQESGIFLIAIDKSEIVSLETEPIESLFQRFESNKELLISLRGKVNFLIFGYDDDKRELFQIPEVRVWAKFIIPRVKYWAYFLDMDGEFNGMKTLHICGHKINNLNKMSDSQGHSIEVDVEETLEFMQNLFGWLNELCDKHGISDEANIEQSGKLMRLLFGDEITNRVLANTTHNQNPENQQLKANANHH